MKVLIYADKNILEPIGGPTGYLYNLYKELKKEKIDNIYFLNNKKMKKKMFIKRCYKKLPKAFQNKYKKFKNDKEKYNILDKVFSTSPKESICDLNEYDMVHFHATLDMYMVKDSLDNYKGKVIITSHTPKVAFKETIEDRLSKEEYRSKKKKLDRLEIVDEYAFNRADYIIFPCEEAEEPYYHSWDKYKEIKEKNKSKYFYLPTGIIPIEIDDTDKKIRRQYNIPENAFIISYVGRHNETKGYDQLKILGERILNKYTNVYFLIAGRETPLKGLENNHWIEIGWTDKPYEIVKASNLFILPNKETYFDLVLLEVLSIGKTVLLTSTGGNKYFEKFPNKALYYYDYGNIEEALLQFSKIYNSSTKELEFKNKKLFLDNFTIKKFTQKYLEILTKIYEGENNE